MTLFASQIKRKQKKNVIRQNILKTMHVLGVK